MHAISRIIDRFGPTGYDAANQTLDSVVGAALLSHAGYRGDSTWATPVQVFCGALVVGCVFPGRILQRPREVYVKLHQTGDIVSVVKAEVIKACGGVAAVVAGAALVQVGALPMGRQGDGLARAAAAAALGSIFDIGYKIYRFYPRGPLPNAGQAPTGTDPSHLQQGA